MSTRTYQVYTYTKYSRMSSSCKEPIEATHGTFLCLFRVRSSCVLSSKNCVLLYACFSLTDFSSAGLTSATKVSPSHSSIRRWKEAGKYPCTCCVAQRLRLHPLFTASHWREAPVSLHYTSISLCATRALSNDFLYVVRTMFVLCVICAWCIHYCSRESGGTTFWPNIFWRAELIKWVITG